MSNDLKVKKIRIFAFCFLFAVYFFTLAADYAIKEIFFGKHGSGGKAAAFTMEHFSQPTGNIIISPSQLDEFLQNAVFEKENFLSYKLFYIGLLVLYLISALSIFRKLFP